MADPKDDAKSEARARILARRAKYVALALAGAGLTACGSTSQVCLDIAAPPDAADDAGDAGDTQPQVCLEPPLDAGDDADTTPQPCLGVALDAGDDADTAPQPCLSPVLDAGDDADSTPQPCLSPPPADGGAG